MENEVMTEIQTTLNTDTLAELCEEGVVTENVQN